MLNIKKIENICAIIIIVAFFLPWVSLGIISFSGYDLPNLASLASSFDAAFSENGESSGSANSLYAVYLIPLLSISILFMEYLGKESKKLCLTAGTLNVVGFLYVLIFVDLAIVLFPIACHYTKYFSNSKVCPDVVV